MTPDPTCARARRVIYHVYPRVLLYCSSSMAKAPLCSRDLSIGKVLQLLQNPEESSICHLPPVKPKAGEIYLYEATNKESVGEYRHCTFVQFD